MSNGNDIRLVSESNRNFIDINNPQTGKREITITQGGGAVPTTRIMPPSLDIMDDPSQFGLDLLVAPEKRGALSTISSRSASVVSGYSGRSGSGSGSGSDASSVSGSYVSEEPYRQKGNRSGHGDGGHSSHNNRSERRRSYTPSVSGSEDSDSSFDDDSVSVVENKPRPQQVYITEEEINNKKSEYLYMFDRIMKKGVNLPKRFTMQSSLDEMKAEYDRIMMERKTDNSVKFQRRILMATVSGIEFLNGKFDPFDVRLDGWSEKIQDDIDEFDEIFEELHEKYKEKAKVAPELKLLFTLCSSAFMFHMTNSMFKSSGIPGLEQVLKQNPELAKQFAAATANTMKQNDNGGLMGGMAGMFSNMFGGGGSSAPPMPMNTMPPPRPMNRAPMKPPNSIDNILNDFNGPMNDRIEVMSTSDLSEIPDDASMSGMFIGTNKKGKRTMQL
jgi:hypothetical protein